MTVQLGSLASDFRINDLSLTSVGTNFTQIVPPNPNRWALIIEPISGQTGHIWPVMAPAFGNGIIINSSRPIWMVNFRDFGPMVGAAWFGTTVGAPSPWSILEIIYLPYAEFPGGEQDLKSFAAKTGGK